jgi:hypothetical protein
VLSATAAMSSRERRWRRHLTDFRWPWAEYLPGRTATIIYDKFIFLYQIFNTHWTVKCVPFEGSKSYEYIIKQAWEALHVLYTQLPLRLYMFKQRCMLPDTSWIRFRAGRWYSIMQWIYRKESVRDTPSNPHTYSTCTVLPLFGRQTARHCGCPPLVVRDYKTRKNKRIYEHLH